MTNNISLNSPGIHNLPDVDGDLEGLCDFNDIDPLDLLQDVPPDLIPHQTPERLLELYTNRYPNRCDQRPLFVRRLEPSEYPIVEKIAEAWLYIAVARKQFVQKSEPDNKFYAQQLADSQFISSILAFNFGTTDFSEVCVCVDEQQQYHAIVMTDHNRVDRDGKRYSCVSRLITNPINIRSSTNPFEDQRVRGAASLLMDDLEETGAALGNDRVSLGSRESAKKYYEGRGYVENADEYHEKILPKKPPMGPSV